MARFYGDITGRNNSIVTKTGDDRSGITAHIRGWDIGAYIRLFVNEEGRDEIVISTTGGSNNPNQTTLIFRDEHGVERLLNIGQEFRLVLPKDEKLTLNTEN